MRRGGVGVVVGTVGSSKRKRGGDGGNALATTISRKKKDGNVLEMMFKKTKTKSSKIIIINYFYQIILFIHKIWFLIIYSKEKTKQTLSIVNVMSSTIARESNFALPIMAGHEVGVASTKAFTSQLFTLAALSISAGIERQSLTEIKLQELVAELLKLPDLIKKALLK